MCGLLQYNNMLFNIQQGRAYHLVPKMLAEVFVLCCHAIMVGVGVSHYFLDALVAWNGLLMGASTFLECFGDADCLDFFRAWCHSEKLGDRAMGNEGFGLALQSFLEFVCQRYLFKNSLLDKVRGYQSLVGFAETKLLLVEMHCLAVGFRSFMSHDEKNFNGKKKKELSCLLKMKTVEKIVTASHTGTKLRNYLIHQFRPHPFLQRKDCLHALRSKRVHVNHQITLDSYPLQLGDLVTVQINPTEIIQSKLQSMDVRAHYTMEDWMVLEKGPGLNHPEVEWAASAVTDQEGWMMVNEVEKGVRGLCLLARTTDQHQELKDQILDQQIMFELTLLCHGHLDTSRQPTIKDTEGFHRWCLNNHLPLNIYQLCHLQAIQCCPSSSSPFNYISLVRVQVKGALNPGLVARRLMSELGYPVIGSQGHSQPLANHRDKGSLVSYTGIDVSNVRVGLEVPAKILAVIDRESKFYQRKQQQNQQELLAHNKSSLDGKPVAYVTGMKEFCGHQFIVTEDTLIPRVGTEALVEYAVKHSNKRVLDLGTGTGCVLVSILLQSTGTVGVGMDISEPALQVAQQNIAKHRLGDRANLVQADFFTFSTQSGILENGPFDCIVCNPPYTSPTKAIHMQIAHEPQLALVAEDNGFRAYRQIRDSILSNPSVLAPKGKLVLEIGKGMERGVRGVFLKEGRWREVATGRDCYGFLRVLVFELAVEPLPSDPIVS